MTMSIAFNDQYLNATVNKDPREPGEKYRVRCWHETAGKSGNPHSTLRWNLHKRDPKTGRLIQSSYDVLIARDGEIWRYVDWKVWNSWSEGLSSWTVDGKLLQSGPLGRVCMGIELDGANDGKQKATDAQIESAARFAIFTAETEGIPLDGDHDVTHAQIAPGRKTDPRGYSLNDIFDEVARLQRPSEPDWRKEWYWPNWDLIQSFGIPTRWKEEHQAGRPLGKPLFPDERPRIDGRVDMTFEQGYITYSAREGVKVWR